MYGGDQGRYSMETLSTTNGIKTVLVISQIIKEDAGLYSCDLSNPFGRDKHTIKIVVRGTILTKMKTQASKVKANNDIKMAKFRKDNILI